MGIGTDFAGDLSALVLNATPIANVADNAGTAPLTNIYMALHTADPAGGNQTTSEAAYTSYARQALARDGTRFAVSGLTATLQGGDEDFPEATGGTESLTHISIGSAETGTGKIWFIGRIEDGAGNAAPIPVSTGTIPRIKAGTTIVFSAVPGA
jgi:hypothetical protein